MFDMAGMAKKFLSSPEGEQMILEYLRSPEGMKMAQNLLATPEGMQIGKTWLSGIVGSLNLPEEQKQTISQILQSLS